MSDMLSVEELQEKGIFANSPISKEDLRVAEETLKYVHKKTAECIKNGSGPFFAVIKDRNGKIVSQEANSVVNTSCSSAHAEMNTIGKAEQVLKTYDLAPYDLSIYVNAEPCIMCIGGIMWSGIKTVYYSVTSEDVEKITGFDEGFKPNWLNEFKKRGIKVYGNIIPDTGKDVLEQYVSAGHKVYKPSR